MAGQAAVSDHMGVPVPGRALVGLALILALGSDNAAEGCSCHPAHPQQLFCYSDVGEWESDAFYLQATWRGLMLFVA